jgi:plasmid stabilization system protein ParE
MVELRLLSKALRELHEAIDWYETRSSEATARFASAVEKCLDDIQRRPTQFPYWDDTYRYVRVKKFPYYIAYRILTNAVLVVTIRHTSRGSDPFE